MFSPISDEFKLILEHPPIRHHIIAPCLSFYFFGNAVFSLGFVSLTSFPYPPPKATKWGVSASAAWSAWMRAADGWNKKLVSLQRSRMDQRRVKFVRGGLSEVPTSSWKTSWRHGRQELGKHRPGLLYIPFIHFSVCTVSPQIHACWLNILLCSYMFIYVHLLFCLTRIYLIVKSNWCGLPTADIWAQLYSLEETSKPYFREQKHVYLDNLFLYIPSVTLSVVPQKQQSSNLE